MGHHVDYRETLVAYLNSETPDQAAKTLNINMGALHSRLYTMKKNGVKIPPHPGARKVFDSLYIAQLNSIIKKHEKDNKN